MSAPMAARFDNKTLRPVAAAQWRSVRPVALSAAVVPRLCKAGAGDSTLVERRLVGRSALTAVREAEIARLEPIWTVISAGVA